MSQAASLLELVSPKISEVSWVHPYNRVRDSDIRARLVQNDKTRFYFLIGGLFAFDFSMK